MSILNKYLFKNLFITLSYVSFGLISAIWLTQSLRLIELVISGGASAGTFLKLLILSLPTFSTFILPIALLISITFTYNKFINDRELIIMRSTGLSSYYLARPALILCGLVSILCYSLTLYVAPNAYNKLRNSQTILKNSYASLLLKEGTFNTLRPGLTVYIEEKTSHGELKNIFIHDTRKVEKPVSLFAKKGVLLNQGQESKILIFQGSREEFNPKTGQINILDFEKYLFNLEFFKTEIKKRIKDPRELSTSDLFFKKDTGKGTVQYLKNQSEFHQRFSAPLYAIGLAIIGLFFMLSGEFDRKGQSRRLLYVTLSALTVEIAGIGLSNLTTKHPDLIPLIYLMPLAPLILYFIFGKERIDK